MSTGGYCSVEVCSDKNDEGTVTTYYAVDIETGRNEYETNGCLNEAAYMVNGEHACYQHLTVVVDLHLLQGNRVDVQAVEFMVSQAELCA